MIYNYNGIKVHYQTFGKPNSEPILLLHGWGGGASVFEGLINFFKDRYFIAVDLPPFAKSKDEPQNWTIFSYASMLMSLCEHMKISGAHLVGHSFGGRIAILLSALNCTYFHSCILIDSAGMKPKRTIKYRYKILKFKLYKSLGKTCFNLGSSDYLALSPAMRKVFVGIVNTHLEDYLDKIRQPTLIVWGEKDKETPIYMARRLKKKIKNSTLKVLYGGHYVFLDSPLAFYKIVNDFWEKVCCM